MNRGDIFDFTAPNGVKVRALCLENITTIGVEPFDSVNICYAQGRLFAIQDSGDMYQLISDWIDPKMWDEGIENINKVIKL